MGLWVSHGCFDGAYSSFGEWRRRIALAAGYETKSVDFVSGLTIQAVDLDIDEFDDKNLNGEWDETPDDILLVLLVHFDYRGVIKPEHAGPLADRLEEIARDLPAEEEYQGFGLTVRERTTKFIEGLRQAAEAGETVKFR